MMLDPVTETPFLIDADNAPFLAGRGLAVPQRYSSDAFDLVIGGLVGGASLFALFALLLLRVDLGGAAPAVMAAAALGALVFAAVMIRSGWCALQRARTYRTRARRVDGTITAVELVDEGSGDWFLRGASGYLLKNVAPADLIKAVRGTMSGQAHIDPAVAGKLLTHIAVTDSTLPSAADEIKLSDLTERELEILAQLGNGLSNEEIAGRLHLSTGTVRNYVSSIFSKLNISDRTQAAIIAVRYGLGGN